MEKPESLLYLEIAESIRRQITAGELKPGDKLLPIRELARLWNCTPGTVMRAYARLTQEKLVTGHRGGGTHVAPNILQPDPPLWRRAALINRAESFLLEALAGGHTPLQAEIALEMAIARWREMQSRENPPHPIPSNLETLRFSGSHDLALEFLVRMMAQTEPGIPTKITYAGSLAGLIALVHNEADIAGIHLWDAETNSYNVPFVQRILPGRVTILLTLGQRMLGLITPAGNPLGIASLADLTRPHIRFINRLPGSGTRVWLDTQLQAQGITPKMIQGYDQAGRTHLTVAQAILEGKADVGLGIRAAAAVCGLDFIPLTQERYDLVIPEENWNAPTIQELIKIVRSSRFKETLEALGGYDSQLTGQEIRVIS